MQISNYDLQTIINKAEQDGFDWQERRHAEWRENYSLYRNKIIVNRLTQRQSVNIPIMKRGVKALLAKYGTAVDVVFDNKNNDKQKELEMNETWQEDLKENKYKIVDLVDKKQAALYGRTFQKLYVQGGRIKIGVVDSQNIKLSRFTNPVDFQTSYFLEEHGIFRSLGDISNNPLYDQDAIDELKEYYATQSGLMRAAENRETLDAQNERMKDMGSPDIDSVEVGVTVVELRELYIKLFDEEKNEDVMHLIVISPMGGENAILMFEPLEEVIGKTKDDYWRYNYPYESWSTDPDATDVWNDAAADSLRVSNKIANSIFSQMVENGTLKNFNMKYYNSDITSKGVGRGGRKQPFVPQTITPGAGQWVPFPGNPNTDIKDVIPGNLDNRLDELKYIVDVAEQTNATSSIQQGVPENGSMTLGEVEILNYNSKEITNIDLIDYKASRRRLAEKYVKLIEAMADQLDDITLFKKGYRGNMFSHRVKMSNLLTKDGYVASLKSNTERTEELISQISKLKAARAEMPENKPLEKISQERYLDLIKLSPEEKKEVLDYQKKLEEKVDEMENAGEFNPLTAAATQGVATNTK